MRNFDARWLEARAPRGSGSGPGMLPVVPLPKRWRGSMRMSERLSEWLARREAADAAARSEDLLAAVLEALPSSRPLRVLDLGTGTGSNVRYLSARLPRPQ